jgi:hypothetical protein
MAPKLKRAKLCNTNKTPPIASHRYEIAMATHGGEDIRASQRENSGGIATGLGWSKLASPQKIKYTTAITRVQQHAQNSPRMRAVRRSHLSLRSVVS